MAKGLILRGQSWGLELLLGNEQGKRKGSNCLRKAHPFFPGLGLLRAVIGVTAEVSLSSILLLLVMCSTRETEEMMEAPFLQDYVNLSFRSLA